MRFSSRRNGKCEGPEAGRYGQETEKKDKIDLGASELSNFILRTMERFLAGIQHRQIYVFQEEGLPASGKWIDMW